MGTEAFLSRAQAFIAFFRLKEEPRRHFLRNISLQRTETMLMQSWKTWCFGLQQRYSLVDLTRCGSFSRSEIYLQQLTGSLILFQTVSVVQTFVLVMALYPEIQRQAQAEIDRVIGPSRLPKMADREDLQYVAATIKETLRWGTVSPLALPRSAAREDVVMGYRIPKGCLVFTNIWGMLHDESVYPDPEKFDPSRFVGEKQQPDPRELAFGRGRRVCPGQYIAEASVFIQVASLLATFDIRRGFDDANLQCKPDIGFTTAIVR